MSDIVERLRTRPTGDPYLHMMIHEAADEIERLRAEVAGLREALQMWLTLHDNPAGYTGKYGKALDAAIAAQQTKIDAAATAARTALAARKGEA